MTEQLSEPGMSRELAIEFLDDILQFANSERLQNRAQALRLAIAALRNEQLNEDALEWCRVLVERQNLLVSFGAWKEVCEIAKRAKPHEPQQEQEADG